MNYLSILNTVFSVYNFIVNSVERFIDISSNVYRLCTEKPIWYILDNGNFVNSSYFNIFDKEKCWVYDGTTLIKNNNLNSKKIPFLSFEFKYENITITMDEFIESTRYKGSESPPLAVIMSAFAIYNKILYPWTLAHFTIFSKMGDKIEFDGSDGKIPE
jgi:hypothetical protein